MIIKKRLSGTIALYSWYSWGNKILKSQNYFTKSLGKKLVLIFFIHEKKTANQKKKFLHQKFSSEKTFLSKSDAGAALQTTFSMYDSFS